MLFHGTSRSIEGDFLQPSEPGGDVGDPDFPVVFASQRFDFAALFSVKNRGVSHISTGPGSFLLLRPGDRTPPDQPGWIIPVAEQGFTPILVNGRATSKWWSAEPVRIPRTRAIPVGGRGQLVDLGVLVLGPGPRAAADPGLARAAAQQLDALDSRADFWAALHRFIGSGHLDCLEARQWTRGELARELARATEPGAPDRIARYFDSVVAARMDLRVRTRLTHGVDHACRTAIIARLLYHLLLEHGILEPWPIRDVVALMVTAFLHDCARQVDTGPDRWVAASAAAVADELDKLSFSAEALELGRARLLAGAASSEIGAAIIHTADALELVRNYVGDIRLGDTPFVRLLSGRSAAVADFLRLAADYADWMQSLATWGLERGSVLAPDGTAIRTSSGPQFDAIGGYRRSIGTTPFAHLCQSLEDVPALDRWHRSPDPIRG